MGKSAICFLVFWESFSLQSFHSFTHVIFHVRWVSCSEMCFIIWNCFLLQKLYKEAYEQSKGTSINYCDTPKFQTDSVLKNFSDVSIWFMLCCSVRTLLITFVYQLLTIFPGKIQRRISKEYFRTLCGQLWGPTSDTLHESWSYEERCKCGYHTVFTTILSCQRKLMTYRSKWLLTECWFYS